jgi:hypothetical protein
MKIETIGNRTSFLVSGCYQKDKTSVGVMWGKKKPLYTSDGKVNGHAHY